MRRDILIGLTLAATLAFAGAGRAADRPAWVTDEQVAMLRQMGVNPEDDVVSKGYSRWIWQVNRRLAVGDYHCPVGSRIEISKTLMVVRAPDDSPCGAQAGFAKVLKLSPGGGVEPLLDSK
jgi:hypothetical protein